LSITERSKGKKTDLRDFYIRRFFRIAPLFYLAIIVYAWYYYSDLGNPVHTGVQYWQWYYAPSGIPWWHFPLTIFFLNGWNAETIDSIIPLGWSVAVEMTFYVFVPLLYAKIKNAKAALVFILLSIILQQVLVGFLREHPAMISGNHIYLANHFFYFWFFAQLPVFGLGILTFLLFQQIKNKKDPKLGLTLLALSLFLCFAFLKTDSYLDLIPRHIFYALAFMPLALGLYHAPIKLLVNPVTKWIGKVSFSIYLVHFLVLDAMIQVMPDGFLPNKTLGFGVAFLIATLVSALISMVTYRLIEVTGIQLGKYLIHRLKQKETVDMPQISPGIQ
jgi:peptidoglycan/LPS O-acetylase OafA/YrhL